MIFDNTFNTGDIIAFLGLIAVIAGGFFSLYQYNKNTKLKRADYINELTEKIRTDNDISSVIYKIEYNIEWYNDYFHDSGDLERQVDKTLSYFSYICYLKKQKIISDREFKFFKYEVDRILMNEEVVDYFYNLYHFARKFSAPITFQYLFEYGEEINIFDEKFYNRNSYKTEKRYHKRINI